MKLKFAYAWPCLKINQTADIKYDPIRLEKLKCSNKAEPPQPKCCKKIA